MKAKQVLKLLKVTRPTLTSYVKLGKIRTQIMPNGFYEYNADDVYKLSGLVSERVAVTYSRVSTNKQKNDLENQEKTLISYCNANGVQISESYKDIGSALTLDRKEFQRLLDDIINYKVNKVYITYKDRLSRIGFDLFRGLFRHFDCEIIILNDVEDNQLIEKEIFNEIISLIHCFSMRVYSSRRKKKLDLIKQDLENEIDP